MAVPAPHRPPGAVPRASDLEGLGPESQGLGPELEGLGPEADEGLGEAGALPSPPSPFSDAGAEGRRPPPNTPESALWQAHPEWASASTPYAGQEGSPGDAPEVGAQGVLGVPKGSAEASVPPSEGKKMPK